MSINEEALKAYRKHLKKNHDQVKAALDEMEGHKDYEFFKGYLAATKDALNATLMFEKSEYKEE